MNGCPHLFAFALPVPPGRRFPPASGPHPIPVSFLTAPVPRPPTPSLALTSSPLLLSIRAPFVPSTLPLSHSISLYLSSPNVFIVAVFSRDSSPFAVCPCIASSLPRALRTKRARARALARSLARSARCSPLSPGERINDECFTLSPEVGPFAFARARARARAVCFAIIHCVFCTFCVLRESFSLSSLAFTAASQFFHRRFPFPAYLPIRPERGALAPFLSRNSESRFRSRMFFSPLFFVSSSSSFSFPLFFSPWIFLSTRDAVRRFIFFKLESF